MSASMPLAPKRKRSDFSQQGPSSSFIRASHSRRLLGCADAASGFEAYGVACLVGVFADGAGHYYANWKSGVYWFFAGGGFDEVGAGHHGDYAGAGYVAQGEEVAGAEDDF